MILPNSFVVMADKTLKLASDIVVGDILMTVDIKTEIYIPSLVSMITKKVQTSVMCNDMKVGQDSFLGIWVQENKRVNGYDLHFSNPVISNRVLVYKSNDDNLEKSIIHRCDSLEPEQFLEFQSIGQTYIAGPTKFGPFFIFLSGVVLQKVG